MNPPLNRRFGYDTQTKLYLPMKGFIDQDVATPRTEDWSQFGNHATVTGAVMAWPGLTFDGVDDVGNCGNNSSLDFIAAGNYTWLTWINGDTVTGGEVMWKGVPASVGYTFGIFNQKFEWLDIFSGNSVVGVAIIPSMKFTQIACVYSNHAIQFYCDGVADGSGTIGAVNDETTNPLYIGGDGGNNGPFAMTMGETRFEARAFTALDIANHFEVTRRRFGV